MEDEIVQRYIKRLEDLSKGLIGHQLEAMTLQGIQILEARRGYFLCKFIVPAQLSDRDGNWHVGAMSTLIDIVGGNALYSVADEIKVSVDLSISYFSAAKIQEEVVIEAKVVGQRERLTSVMVEVTRKQNGALLALGKQWMASTSRL